MSYFPWVRRISKAHCCCSFVTPHLLQQRTNAECRIWTYKPFPTDTLAMCSNTIYGNSAIMRFINHLGPPSSQHFITSNALSVTHRLLQSRCSLISTDKVFCVQRLRKSVVIRFRWKIERVGIEPTSTVLVHLMPVSSSYTYLPTSIVCLQGLCSWFRFKSQLVFTLVLSPRVAFKTYTPFWSKPHRTLCLSFNQLSASG